MIEQLARDLVCRGLEIKVLAFGQPDHQARPYQVVKAKNKWSFGWELFKLGKEADIIYTFDLYTAGFLSWLIGKKMLGKKLVVRFAGDSAWEAAYNKGQITDDIVTFQDKKYGWRISWLKLVRKLILVGADRIVAVSQFMKDLATKIGVAAGKILVIYNSVDFIEVKNLVERTRALRDYWKVSNFKVLVTGGRLVPWKGIDGLTEVVSELKENVDLPPLKLLVVGEGSDRDRLEKIVEEKKLKSEVIFTGRVPFDEVLYYYNLADIFILNSKYEGMSHMLLEALNFGRPVIASNCGGNSEVIEDEKNGLLVEYNNVEQLRSAIKRMLIEPYWHTSEYQNICRESLKKFNWQNVVDQTMQVFEELITNLKCPKYY